jgi:hypothetical protein
MHRGDQRETLPEEEREPIPRLTVSNIILALFKNQLGVQAEQIKRRAKNRMKRINEARPITWRIAPFK